MTGGFDFSVLSEFRDRMCAEDRAQELLTALLECADAAGLLGRRCKVRTDSTHILARTRVLGRLEKLGEAFRLALEQIARMAPGWLEPRLKPHWEKEFTHPVQIGRLPESDRAREEWGRRVAADGAWLLEQIDTDPVDGWLARLPAVKTLRAIWGQECVVDQAGTWHLRSTRIDPGAEHIDTPHDVEARWSSKRTTQWSGYNVHLSETCQDDLPHLIVAVHTTAATGSTSPPWPTSTLTWRPTGPPPASTTSTRDTSPPRPSPRERPTGSRSSARSPATPPGRPSRTTATTSRPSP